MSRRRLLDQEWDAMNAELGFMIYDLRIKNNEHSVQKSLRGRSVDRSNPTETRIQNEELRIDGI